MIFSSLFLIFTDKLFILRIDLSYMLRYIYLSRIDEADNFIYIHYAVFLDSEYFF